MILSQLSEQDLTQKAHAFTSASMLGLTVTGQIAPIYLSLLPSVQPSKVSGYYVLLESHNSLLKLGHGTKDHFFEQIWLNFKPFSLHPLAIQLPLS